MMGLDLRRIFVPFGRFPAMLPVSRRNAPGCTPGDDHAIQSNGRPHPGDRAKEQPAVAEVIGELAGLSATACQRRLKWLRSDGTIEADAWIVSTKGGGTYSSARSREARARAISSTSSKWRLSR